MTRLFFHNHRLLFFLVSFAISSQCLAFTNNPLDSIPPYEGLRVHLTNIQLVKAKKNKAKIKYNIVNTGRQDIFSNRTTPLSKSLVIEFEDALKNCNCQLAQYQDAIRYQFYYQKINLPVGKSIKNQTMEFTISQAAPPPLVMYRPRKEKVEKSIEIAKIKVLTDEENTHSKDLTIVDKNETNKETPLIVKNNNNTSTTSLDTSNNELPKSISFKKKKNLKKKKEKTPKQARIVKTDIEKNKDVQNNSFTLKKEKPAGDISASSPKKEKKNKKRKKKKKAKSNLADSNHSFEKEKKKNEEALTETIAEGPYIEVESTPAQEVIALEDTTNPHLDSPTASLKDIVSSVTSSKKTKATIVTTTNRSTDIKNESSSFVLNKEELTEKGLETKEIAADKMNCSDLVLTNIKILKQTKNFVTLSYTIHNIGGQPAKIQNEGKTAGQVFAIKAFLSTSEKLTRGALPLGGTFIEKLDKSKNGFLESNASYTGKIKLEIRKKTRFTPNLILSLDPYLAITECDRTNNTAHVVLKD